MCSPHCSSQLTPYVSLSSAGCVVIFRFLTRDSFLVNRQVPNLPHAVRATATVPYPIGGYEKQNGSSIPLLCTPFVHKYIGPIAVGHSNRSMGNVACEDTMTT